MAFFNTNPTSIQDGTRGEAKQCCHATAQIRICRRQPVPNTKGRSISSSEDIARAFSVSYTDYSPILRRPSTGLSCVFLDAYRRPAHYGRTRPCPFPSGTRTRRTKRAQDREQLKSTCAPEKLPAALSKLWPRELPRCCCTNLRTSVRWKSAKC